MELTAQARAYILAVRWEVETYFKYGGISWAVTVTR